MSSPAILIVGGAWHTPEYLAPLAKVFQDKGYLTKCIGLPSVNAHPPAEDFTSDVAAIRTATTDLIAEKKDVVVVLHSLSGIAGTEAMSGLKKGSSIDNDAGVIAVVYIASVLLKVGDDFNTFQEAIDNETWPAARAAFVKDGQFNIPPSMAQEMLYNDVEESQAQYWTSLLKPQSIGPYDSKLTYEVYDDVRTGYILTTMDRAMPYVHQCRAIERVGITRDRTETLETGHTPWLTVPEKVRDAVLRIAGLGLGSE